MASRSKPDTLNSDAQSIRTDCIVCGSGDVDIFFVIERVPVQCNVLWPTRGEALNAPVGTIRLGFCNCCSHIANVAFDPNSMDYTEHYENSLHFSPRFQTFLDYLIQRLDSEFELRGKHVIDVGCGKGEFITALCERTGCFGVGFDKSYALNEANGHAIPAEARFVVDFYGERYAEYPVDLITCRHVLEHIDRPYEFIAMIRRVVGDRTSVGVYFEVPDALFTAQHLGIWDIIYEHVSYFTRHSLVTLFEREGFTVTDVSSVFDGQYLCLSAAAHAPAEQNSFAGTDEISEIRGDVTAFRQRYDAKLLEWKRAMEEIRRSRSKAVVWGTGSKGATFLNAVGVTDEVRYAVDINPRKAGKFVPGTGQEVVSPQFLEQYRPDVVIVMNPIYEAEIRGMLASLQVHAEVLIA
jgi:SAM-dependent methyltransferase